MSEYIPSPGDNEYSSEIERPDGRSFLYTDKSTEGSVSPENPLSTIELDAAGMWFGNWRKRYFRERWDETAETPEVVTYRVNSQKEVL